MNSNISTNLYQYTNVSLRGNLDGVASVDDADFSFDDASMPDDYGLAGLTYTPTAWSGAADVYIPLPSATSYTYTFAKGLTVSSSHKIKKGYY